APEDGGAGGAGGAAAASGGAGAGGSAGGGAAAGAGGAGAAGGAVDFLSGLPDDLKTHGALAGHKNLEGLVRSYVHAQGMIGVPPERVLKIPTKADDAAGWD